MRITQQHLDFTFGNLVDAATARGIDASRWSFGTHFGASYQIIDEGREFNQQISQDWSGRSAAWSGMVDMIKGLTLVPVKA